MSTSTPSPPSVGTPNTTASRRPPRKSTLTQQQKNQKRQRATQDQLNTLESEFAKNPTPTAAVRDRIAQDINMTERSVQIWFQNRRAKIKNIVKKNIETGEDCDQIPDSMRHYLAVQAMESGRPLARSSLGPRGAMVAYGSGDLLLAPEQPTNPSKVVIHHFSCKSLSIGTWRRVGQNTMDLVVFYSPDKACLTYYINNDSAGYKIEYPFAHIKSISLENDDLHEGANGLAQRPGGLLIEVNRPPSFFMDSSGSGGFYQCGDFTEDQQASQVMVHHLGGHPKVLSGQLAKLLALDSFQNRHSAFNMHAMPASAPVSPVGNRPASQPNQMSHPHLNAFHDNPFGMGPPMNPRGHKRTRSRSVPIAIDFSMLHGPMPSFHIQHPSTHISDPSIYAPIPQHSNNPGSLGPNLRIDTSSGYRLDFRPHPLSTATTNSPSEYASPSYYASGLAMEAIPAANFNNQYSLPFLSPMIDPAHMIHPSVSPLSSVSHGDPVIADQSPPLSNMHRSASADFLSLSQDHQASVSDDGIMLSEMYSKQNLNMPMHSPNLEETNLGVQYHDVKQDMGLGMPSPSIEDSTLGMQFQEGGSSDEMDIHSMLPFGTMDPSSLSPENIGM